MRRATSLQGAMERRGEASGGRNVNWGHERNRSSTQNATWDTGTQQSHLPNQQSPPHHVMTLESRRGSNQTIPGQQVPGNYPIPNGVARHPNRNGDISQVPPANKQSGDGSINKVHVSHINTSMHRKRSSRRQRSRIYDDPSVVAGYNSVPLIELDRLPRGGITLETKAVGRIQVREGRCFLRIVGSPPNGMDCSLVFLRRRSRIA